MNNSSPILIGHRGARGLAPENTLLGLDTGIRAGCAWVEFDVQLHPSGELFLLHDLTLERTTNGVGRAALLPWERLRALDAGAGQNIPTLDEALDLVDGRVIANIELKTWDGTATAVACLLDERLQAGLPPEKLLVSSFHLPELYEFKQRLPEVPVGVLCCGVPLDYAAVATELEAASINLSAEFVDSRIVTDAKARGLAVYVYTVNTPGELDWLMGMGVDGVFTDYPDRLMAGRRKSLNPRIAPQASAR